MGTNTFKFDANGNLSALVYVQASVPYRCECGHEISFTIDWPENLEQVGAISVKGVSCPNCSKPVALPKARYWIENFVLCSEPIPE